MYDPGRGEERRQLQEQQFNVPPLGRNRMYGACIYVRRDVFEARAAGLEAVLRGPSVVTRDLVDRVLGT